MDTTHTLKEAAETSAWLRDEIIRRAAILGCDVEAEGRHFRFEVAAEYLGHRGWTVSDVQNAAA